MTSSLYTVPLGDEAIACLARVIDHGQRDNPLARITVVAPTRYSVLSLRRALAEPLARPVADGGDRPRRAGLINVRFLTMDELMRQIGPHSATGTVTPSRLATAGATRAAARARGADMALLLEHPNAESALFSILEELSSAGTMERWREWGGSRLGSLVALAQDRERRLIQAGYTPRSVVVADASAALAEDSGALGHLGHVAIYLPSEIQAWMEPALDALAGSGRLSVILGLCGDEEADSHTYGLADYFRPRIDGAEATPLPTGPAPPPAPPAPPQLDAVVIDAPDRAVEAREAVRRVVQALRQGSRPDRIVIGYAQRGDYPRLLAEALSEAGLTYAGASPRKPSAMFAARLVLTLLSLHRRPLGPQEVCDLISSGPLRNGTSPIPAQRWCAIAARSAAGSRGDWEHRLEEFSGWSRDRGLGDTARKDASEMAAWVSGLRGRLDRLAAMDTWTAVSTWCQEALSGLAGGPRSREHWPEREIQAATAVEAALGRMGCLDGLDDPPSPGRFADTLARELDASDSHEGMVGRGILVAPIGALVGMVIDTAILVGLNEGALPVAVPTGGILSEGERRIAGLADHSSRVRSQRFDYLALARSARELIKLFPRAGGGRELFGSPWLDLGPGGSSGATETIDSLESWIDGQGDSASGRLRRLAALASCPPESSRHNHPLAQGDPLRRRIQAVTARSAATFGEWEGEIPPPEGGEGHRPKSVSPTSLERYARCPRSYLLAEVLGLRPQDDTGAQIKIGPADRGTVIHEILQRFVAERIASRQTVAAGDGSGTTSAGLSRLVEIAHEVFAAFEARGATGNRALWEAEKEAILALLEAFFEHDRAREREGAQPYAVERVFGSDAAEPVTLGNSLGGIALVGRVDRVDLRGSKVEVLDYKTGSDAPCREVGQGALGRAKGLQAALYGLAVGEVLAKEEVWTGYWILSEARICGFDLGRAEQDLVKEIVGTLTEGIVAGHFPARPGPLDGRDLDHCRNCDFDRCCVPGSARTRAWQHQAQDGRLAKYVALVEGGR